MSVSEDHFSQPASANQAEALVTYLLFWSRVECGLGVIVVCLPTLRSLYGSISPKSILSGIKSVFSLWSVQSHSSTEPGIHRLKSLDRLTKASSSRSDRPEHQLHLEGIHSIEIDLERQNHLPTRAATATEK